MSIWSLVLGFLALVFLVVSMLVGSEHDQIHYMLTAIWLLILAVWVKN